MGQLMGRQFMLEINGTKHAKFLTQMVVDQDVNAMIDWMSNKHKIIPHYVSHELADPHFVPFWDDQDIIVWMSSIGLGHLDFLTLLYLQNGMQLINLNRYKMEGWSLEEDPVMNALRIQHIREVDHLLLHIARVKLDSELFPVVLVNNYVDDFFFFLTPVHSNAKWVLDQFTSFIPRVGSQESMDKRFGPTLSLDLLGNNWETHWVDVMVADDKVHNVLQIIEKLIRLRFMLLEPYESLCGKLSNMALYIWPGRAFIRRLTHWAVGDLRWWAEYLSNLQRLSIIAIFETPRVAVQIWVDGATNGQRDGPRGWRPAVGGFMAGHYFSEEVPPRLVGEYLCLERQYKKKFAIMHFEMLSIIVALATFVKFIPKGAHITVWCDNEGVEGIFKSKSTNDLYLQQALRWTLMRCVKNLNRLICARISTQWPGNDQWMLDKEPMKGIFANTWQY